MAVATKADSEDVYTKEEVYTKDEIHTYVASEIGSAGHLNREIVAVLPEGEEIDVDTIYMVLKNGAEGSDVYVEYMYINNDWEVIGDTTVDLTPYATTEYVDLAIEGVGADITALGEVVATKATQEDLESAISDINVSLETKAVKADVEAELATKAVKSEVESALAEKAVKSEVESALAELSEEIEAVSNGAKTYTDEEIVKVNAVIETKVDNSTYTETINNITESITNINNVIGEGEGSEGSLLTRIGALESGKADKATSLAGYGITDVYTKGETYTRKEISDLIAQITGGESAADVLAALNTYIGTNDEAIAGLKNVDTAFENRIAALENIGAQANVLEAINFNGQDIAIVGKKATFSYTYDLPAAMADALGGVKSSTAENKIAVDAEGTMEVNSLNVNKLTQTTGDTLVLNGGSANL